MADLARYATTIGGIITIVPALVILVAALSRFDRRFKDETLFLMFMGGLVAGFLLALFEAFTVFISPGGMALLGFPGVEQLAKTAILNRKKHQDDRAIVFYGGAFGVGLAAMLSLVRSARDPAFQTFDTFEPAFYVIIVGVSLLLVHFATGSAIGRGVLQKTPFHACALAVVLTAPLYVMMFEFDRGRALLYLPMMLAYGLALFYWATDKILPEGLDDEARRQLRRAKRKQARDEVE
ncbi:MAG: hypothetical protein HY556_07945 [Euryarchaeota archaeon]|nr:hypothetical protein [Euryarchaeota archaeon]